MPSINPAASSRFVFRVTAANMPSSVKAAYQHCAIMEIDGDLPADFMPAAIDERIRGVRRIVESWGPYPSAGKTARSGKQTALREAAARLTDLLALGSAVEVAS